MRTRRTSRASLRGSGRSSARVRGSGQLASLVAVLALVSGLGAVLVAAGPAAAVTPPAPGWTTQEAPLPSDAGTGGTDPHVYIASSVCPSPTGCYSVGWYDDTTGAPWGLIESQNGGTWTVTEAPEPQNAGSGPNQALWIGSESCGYIQPCRAISCPTATSCVAVGEYKDTAGYSLPVVETLSNGTWTATEGALPSDAAVDTGSTSDRSYLYSVACTSVTSCVAVGGYWTMTGDFKGFIATLSGSSWSAVASPLPPGALASGSFLYGVSCASASSCVAVGRYVDAGSRQAGLLDTLANGSWAASPAPQPADAGSDTDGHQDSILFQVSCASATACRAVGFYVTNGGVSRPWSTPSTGAPGAPPWSRSRPTPVARGSRSWARSRVRRRRRVPPSACTPTAAGGSGG